MVRFHIAFLISILAVPVAAAGLFESSDSLTVALEGPVGETFRDKSDPADERDFVLSVDNVRVPVKVRPRGNSRRANCRFPPLRLNFDKDLVSGSPFDGQDKLKLVTHCEVGREANANVMEEYFAYRLLNLLTDKSFRVRRLHITYIDGKRSSAHNAFVIEPKDALVARIGGQLATEPFPERQLEPHHMTITALFQYAIGNTDFSFMSGPAGEDCCHNSSPVVIDGRTFSVPYDFDRAGIVNVAYAAGNPELGIRDVRERRFRGFCTNDTVWNEALGTVMAARDEVFATLDAIDGLQTKTYKKMRRYLEGFYRQAARNGAASIRKRCR